MHMLLNAARADAAEALRLREWALQRLLRDVDAVPPAVSAGGWRLFLRCERCAALLEESLRRTGRLDALDEAGSAALREAVLREMRRVLSARAQLGTVRRLAEERGWSVIVLKGGRDVALGTSLMVVDVDVLAVPTAARELAAALDAIGFIPVQRDSATHLRPRTSPAALQIEVHLTVSGFGTPESVPWEETEQLPGFAPLRMMAPQHHAWVVLCQAMRKHPDRRLRVRDLVMLRNATAACTPAQRQWLARQVAQDAQSRLHADVLERVTRGADDAAELRRVARAYLLTQRRLRSEPFSIPAILQRMADHIVAEGGVLTSFRRRAALRQRPMYDELLHMVAIALAGGIATVATLDAPLVIRQSGQSARL